MGRVRSLSLLETSRLKVIRLTKASSFPHQHRDVGSYNCRIDPAVVAFVHALESEDQVAS